MRSSCGSSRTTAWTSSRAAAACDGVELRVTEIVAPGQVFMPFHYVETNANQVTQSAFDPISREPNYKQCAVQCRADVAGITGGMTMEELVVVGNGMAGMACVEQILKHAPKFRHHGLRRRDARQLQPHPALVGAGRREVGRRHRASTARVVSAERHRACASASGSSTSTAERRTVTGDDGSVTPYDKLLLATGSSAFMPPIDGRRQGDVFTLPHSRRHARAARSAPARA